ncbi:hypothetical protein [Deinococcus sp. NW-56]|uniref:hypothetical protein n=1 Tax=Deinococcus sp. NW-56 TaxID=2080419 RepID=UPI00131A0A02|nr:hypothetical protein [Deinococcus sp. NW-56]
MRVISWIVTACFIWAVISTLLGPVLGAFVIGGLCTLLVLGASSGSPPPASPDSRAEPDQKKTAATGVTPPKVLPDNRPATPGPAVLTPRNPDPAPRLGAQVLNPTRATDLKLNSGAQKPLVVAAQVAPAQGVSAPSLASGPLALSSDNLFVDLREGDLAKTVLSYPAARAVVSVLLVGTGTCPILGYRDLETPSGLYALIRWSAGTRLVDLLELLANNLEHPQRANLELALLRIPRLSPAQRLQLHAELFGGLKGSAPETRVCKELERLKVLDHMSAATDKDQRSLPVPPKSEAQNRVEGSGDGLSPKPQKGVHNSGPVIISQKDASAQSLASLDMQPLGADVPPDMIPRIRPVHSKAVPESHESSPNLSDLGARIKAILAHYELISLTLPTPYADSTASPPLGKTMPSIQLTEPVRRIRLYGSSRSYHLHRIEMTCRDPLRFRAYLTAPGEETTSDFAQMCGTNLRHPERYRLEELLVEFPTLTLQAVERAHFKIFEGKCSPQVADRVLPYREAYIAEKEIQRVHDRWIQLVDIFLTGKDGASGRSRTTLRTLHKLMPQALPPDDTAIRQATVRLAGRVGIQLAKEAPLERLSELFSHAEAQAEAKALYRPILVEIRRPHTHCWHCKKYIYPFDEVCVACRKRICDHCGACFCGSPYNFYRTLRF